MVEHQVLWVTKDPLESLAKMDNQGLLEIQDQEEILEKMDPPVNLDRQVR